MRDYFGYLFSPVQILNADNVRNEIVYARCNQFARRKQHNDGNDGILNNCRDKASEQYRQVDGHDLEIGSCDLCPVYRFLYFLVFRFLCSSLAID